MNQNNQTFGKVVLLIGLALIYTGFFLLVPSEKRNDVFWLNLIVANVVYFASYIRINGLFVSKETFNKNIAGLGIQIEFIPIYILIAITIAIACWYNKIEFRYQLYLQLIAGFFLLTIFFLSYLSSDKTLSIQAEQDINRKGKEEILFALNQFQILFALNTEKWIHEKQKINFLIENVRYLSPSNNPSATNLDSEIVSNIQTAYKLANDKNEGSRELFSLLNKCEELLKIRKTIYSD